jgi:hypothetical protein
MCLRITGWGGMNLIYLAGYTGQWRALVKAIQNIRVPQNIVKFLSS